MNGLEGAPLTKQYSSSLFQPSSLLDYQNTLRSNETGYLEVSVNNSHSWTRRWFELKDGVIRHADSPSQADYEPSVFIPIENIITLVTSNKQGNNTIYMKTTQEKIYLKTESSSDLARWVFAFQKSVALALLMIKSHGPMSQLVDQDESFGGSRRQAMRRRGSEDWTREEFGGHGHDGMQSKMALTRNMMATYAAELKKTSQQASSRASTDDTVMDLMHHKTHIAHLREKTERDWTFGDLTKLDHDGHLAASKRPEHPVSAPTTPVKASWSNGNWPLDSAAAYCDRHTSALDNDHDRNSDYFDDLGLVGDVVMTSLQPTMRLSQGVSRDETLRGESSHGNTPEPPEWCSDSLGASTTWRSVEDMSKLVGGTDGGGAAPVVRSACTSSPLRRSRSTSEDTGIFVMDLPDGDSENDEQTCSHSSSTSHIRWLYGATSKMGNRSSNEDRCVAVPDLFADVSAFMEAMAMGTANTLPFYGSDRGVQWREAISTPRTCGKSSSAEDAFFAVYDGHSGQYASQHLQTILHHSIYTHPLFEQDLETAIFDTCINVDRELLHHCRKESLYCGTTAVGAILDRGGRRLTVFNIGDSQAVLCREGQPVDMSVSHCPSRPDEERRIVDAQGWITEERELYYGRLHRMDLNDPDVVDAASGIDWTTIYRVCGEIAVSRSIGDTPYKGFTPGEQVLDYFAWPDGHSQVFMADLIIPDPEFISVDLHPGDEFLILASDGLWDVVSKPEAVRRVRASFDEGKPPETVSNDLCELAIRLGSSDNVTVVVVQFIHMR